MSVAENDYFSNPVYFSSPAFLDIHVLTSFAGKTCGLFWLKPASMREPAYFSNPAFTNNVSWYQSIIMLNSFSL